MLRANVITQKIILKINKIISVDRYSIILSKNDNNYN